MDLAENLSFSLGDIIRNAREKKGISRVKLAQFIGASANSMIKYEKAGSDGGQYPPIIKMVKICEILEIDPRRVFDRIHCQEYQTSTDDAYSFSTFIKSREEGHNMEYIGSKLSFLDYQIGEVYDEISQINKALQILVSKENGLDQNDLDRPISKPSKAVEAAPNQTQSKKGKASDE